MKSQPLSGLFVVGPLLAVLFSCDGSSESEGSEETGEDANDEAAETDDAESEDADSGEAEEAAADDGSDEPAEAVPEVETEGEGSDPSLCPVDALEAAVGGT